MIFPSGELMFKGCGEATRRLILFRTGWCSDAV